MQLRAQGEVMGSFRAFAVRMSLALASFNVGCAAESSSDTGSGEDALHTTFTSPGVDLGRATHVVADDISADAAFVVYNRTLERRTVDGRVESLGRIEAGFEHLVVSKKFAA